MQLMGIAIPAVEQLKKEGEAGRRKITQYTRFGALGLAVSAELRAGRFGQSLGDV